MNKVFDFAAGVDVKHACFGGTQALFDALGYLYRTYSKQRKVNYMT